MSNARPRLSKQGSVLNISENPLENGKAEVLHLVLEHLGDCTLISDMAANNLIAELSVIE
jgi:hypothetical protein